MTKTLEQARKELKNDNERASEALNLEYEIKEITGILPSVAKGNFKERGNCTIHFNCDSVLSSAENVANLSEVKHIIETLPPIKNFTLTFASGDPIESSSPFKLEVHNWEIEGHTPTLSLQYRSELGSVTIEVKGEWFEGLQKSSIQGKHIAFGRYEHYSHYSFPELGASLQKYYGGTLAYYAKDEAQANELKHFIFTGKTL